MRILGFSQLWGKLTRIEFTTFRFARKGRDWQAGETVQIVYKPRSPEREILGTARIISKESRDMVLGHPHLYPIVTLNEVVVDGFNDYWQMWDWLAGRYSRLRLYNEPMNKLTLRWQK